MLGDMPLKATNVLQKNWFTSYLSGRCLINVYCHLNVRNTTNSRTEAAVFVFFSSFYFLFYSSSSYLYNRFARLFLCGTTPSLVVWFPVVASQVKFPRSVVVLSAVNVTTEVSTVEAFALRNLSFRSVKGCKSANRKILWLWKSRENKRQCIQSSLKGT